ncbi:hypothetical protein ACFQ0O_05020 [Saccharopolyspora spinosporotrichia]
MTSPCLAEPTARKPRAQRKRRLVGVDIARFFAVFGMFNIHFGVPFLEGHPEIVVAQFSSGRSTALFTLLAGLSLAMLSGRTVVPRGRRCATPGCGSRCGLRCWWSSGSGWPRSPRPPGSCSP